MMSGRVGVWGRGRGLIALSVCLLVSPAYAQKKQNPFDVEAREYFGTPKSEDVVKRGLDFLAAHQEANGHWNSGIYRDDAAISGLCTLAFLASGHQPGRGKYAGSAESSGGLSRGQRAAKRSR